jgi:hypothetical protein
MPYHIMNEDYFAKMVREFLFAEDKYLIWKK